MFIYTMRAQTIKFIAAVTLAIGVMITLVALIPKYDVSASAKGINYSGIYSNSDRIAFISALGWKVDENPTEEVQVTVPAEFDAVYAGYNEMQKEQGLSLAPYKGKEVTRYTYKVTNYEGYEGEVYINLLVHRSKIIGGDVCSADSSGFIHGFSKDVKYNA